MKILTLVALVALFGVVLSFRWEDCLCTSQKPETVGDCCCSTDAVDQQVDVMIPVLRDLVQRSALRFFRINLNDECPFWNLPEQCRLRQCAICECGDEDVPALVKAVDVECTCQDLDSVDRTAVGAPRPDIDAKSNQFVWAASFGGKEGTYIDLLLNQEQYTGYDGPHIWSAIYKENCFPGTNECRETRVLYRLLSGLHTSINTHLAYHYVPDATCGVTAPNIPLYQDRVGRHADRIENLYFAYSVLLRALNIAAPQLMEPGRLPSSGNATEDAYTQQLLTQALSSELLQKCPQTFDENTLFQGQDGTALRDAFRRHFVNISRIMDCVGCERCQLWGKVQTLGLGTALRLLFCQGEAEMSRNEIVALLHTTNQLGESIRILHVIRAIEQSEGMRWVMNRVFVSLGVVLAVVVLFILASRKKVKPKTA